ncbi:beta-galactosidase [Roseateles toxinivorans]|uniref:Beta-galactosidase n=1 Tax=Roseateles toxinivorans TaxID=270368 RepID=A0A4R6QDE9_9BURK|nr:beta-galactosidase [Roseateles toxinivorans]TDP60481.1 beta-galactosidase [Roseateles toxinivorans]
MRLGVCYYPEQWPEAWWAEDARQMAALGVRLVRIGEFSWSRVEPQPGMFEWGWLDRAVQVLADAGLQLVMCTPTATPPKWLVDLDPDMLAVGEDGRQRRFGSRRHYDFSSDRYLAQAARITRAFAERYGRHPAVVAWQTDNEYGCHDTVVSHSPQAVQRFRGWLQQRYGDVAALNQAWGNVFWSQDYSNFDEIDSPTGTVTEANPAHRLDYRRFASDEVLRFNRAQCQILRCHSPGRVLVHNFMQLFTGFDHHAVASDLDVASWDSYPLGALEMFWFDADDKQRWLRTGHPDFAAFHHDLYRGMSRLPFWVMEQQPGPVNWANWNPAPAPGMVRLWTWEAFAHGADVVSYFRWRQAPFGQEQMHAGLQTPDCRLDVGGAEAAAVAAELALVPTEPTRPAQVALVFDYASLWLLDIQPQGADYNGLRLTYEAYCALRSLGFDVDIVPPGANLNGYSLVVLPSMPLVSDALLSTLQSTSAQVVLYPRTGSKTDAVSIPEGLPPGSLRQLINLRVTRVESLRPGVTDTVLLKGSRHSSTRWRETLDAGPNVTTLAQYSDGQAAVVRQGRTRYLAGWFSAELQRQVIEDAAIDAGMAPVRLPQGLRIRRRGDLLFAFNYNAHPITLAVPEADWLLGDSTLPAHGLGLARRRTP